MKTNTIANLSINEIDMHGVGLIGVLEEAGEIKNLTKRKEYSNGGY